MEEQRTDVPEEEQIRMDRPRWQIWLARIALVVFVALIAMYYVNIARGGL